MSDSIRCPGCKGEGSHMALVRYADGRGCQEQMVPCYQCRGEGQVPAEMLVWIKRGEAMRRDRLNRNLGQREEAKRLGISVVKYSQMEFGKIDPVGTALDHMQEVARRSGETKSPWGAEAEAEREAVRRGAAPLHQGHDGAPCVCAFPDHKREPK